MSPPRKAGAGSLAHVPEVVRRHLAPNAKLNLARTSKVLLLGTADTGKTTMAKHIQLHYPKGVSWDPGHEYKPDFCRKWGFIIARDLEGLEKAARLSSRICLQPPRVARGDDLGNFEEMRRELGDAFCWWALDNLRGPCFVYLDEPHSMFDGKQMRGGLKELLRRGHKEENQLAMGWSAWGAREMPNDLENVTHRIAFRCEERNDADRIDDYFGAGFKEVAQALPDFYHIVRQKDPATRVASSRVHEPLQLEG